MPPPLSTFPPPSQPGGGGGATDVGAIVGGVVGALVAIGLLAGGAAYYHLKVRKNRVRPKPKGAHSQKYTGEL